LACQDRHGLGSPLPHRPAIGRTAVGTGLNTPPGFGDEVATKIAGPTGRPLTSAYDKFAVHASGDASAE
jgi:fumarate hydratase, class II